MSIYVLILIIMIKFAIIGWLWGLVMKRNDVADLLWGKGFMLIAILMLLLTINTSTVQIVISVLVILWGVRLVTHIYKRGHDKPEDYRYRAWREEWMKKGKTYFILRSLFQVYILQALMLYVIALPIIFIGTVNYDQISWWQYAGIALWVVGFFFETVGDIQLSRFMKSPANRGRIMKYGLWRFTRHPNYFGEVTQWWAIFLIVLCTGPYSLVMIISPLLITYSILFLSGIPMLESKWADNQEFQEYKKRTSAFFPLPPKKITQNRL